MTQDIVEALRAELEKLTSVAKDVVSYFVSGEITWSGIIVPKGDNPPLDALMALEDSVGDYPNKPNVRKCGGYNPLAERDLKAAEAEIETLRANTTIDWTPEINRLRNEVVPAIEAESEDRRQSALKATSAMLKSDKQAETYMAERDKATAQLAQANMDVEKILAEFNVLSAMYIKKTGEVPRQDNIDPRARDMLEVVKLSCAVRRLAKKGLRSPVTEEALDEAVAHYSAIRGEQ